MTTTPELTDTMRRATDDLAPGSSDRILARALVGGQRRRVRHQLTVGASSAAVLGVVATTVLLATGGSNEAHRDAPPVASAVPKVAAPSSTPTTYAPGSRTEVPGGPVIPTDRTIVDDASLQQVTRDLVSHGQLTGLTVHHVTGSGVDAHLADTSTDGRAMSFRVDGAGAWIAVGRWDGYHAVGIEDVRHDHPGQKAATTAREACGGSYQSFPATRCTKAPEGWYVVAHPSAGGAVAGATELEVDLYTDDGYVVHVHSLNTAGEKQGPRVGTGTAIDEADSLAIARSPRWFTQR